MLEFTFFFLPRFYCLKEQPNMANIHGPWKFNEFRAHYRILESVKKAFQTMGGNEIQMVKKRVKAHDDAWLFLLLFLFHQNGISGIWTDIKINNWSKLDQIKENGKFVKFNIKNVIRKIFFVDVRNAVPLYEHSKPNNNKVTKKSAL